MKARPDLLWIHAAAVERSGMALLLVGSSGQGKSTLSTRLCEKGWRLMSDDSAPIRMNSNEVLPFPQAPHRRKAFERQMRVDELGIFDKEEVMVSPDSLCRDSATVKVIVFPSFNYRGAADLSLLSLGEAALDLLRNSMNFVDHKEEAVERASRLARDVPMYRLSCGDWQSAARLLEALE